MHFQPVLSTVVSFFSLSEKRRSVLLLVTMADKENSLEGIRIGSKSLGTRAQPRTKDQTPDKFWSRIEETKAACKAKAQNPKWGKRKIAEHVCTELKLAVTESQVQRYVESFLFYIGENTLFYKSTQLNEVHRRCLTRDELIDLLKVEHERDHRAAETCYSSLRVHYHPVIRENICAIFKQFVKCEACQRQAPIPKTSLIRKSILAPYPNSRWQMDLKKLPSAKGYEYACNVVDCYSRFAMGGAIKSKSAKDVCEVLLRCIYIYGAPRILQTDNGKEFNNGSLAAVMEEMKSLKINGRPYHPQSQGRVERLNQTLANFLRRDLLTEKDWPSRLQYFYFTYNTRSHKALKGKTPFETYHRRPNFSLYVSHTKHDLTAEEQEFLSTAHLDFDGEDEDPEQSEDEEPNQAQPDLPTHATNEETIEAAVDVDEPYPLEVQYSTEEKFTVGQQVLYYKAPSLGGAAGTAALARKWFEGQISAILREEGNFLLYEVSSPCGLRLGRFSSAHVKAKESQLTIPFTSCPEGWMTVPTPMSPRAKRRRM